MLSFGHAVYTGLGSFPGDPRCHEPGRRGLGMSHSAGAHSLVGGLAGMFFAVLLGFVTTKKAGTTFAMITLGMGTRGLD